jgi:hypothetical protein
MQYAYVVYDVTAAVLSTGVYWSVVLSNRVADVKL